MAEKYLDISKDQYQTLTDMPVDGPVIMVNLLKFKDLDPLSQKAGSEMYLEYMSATAPFFAKVNAKVIFMGSPLLTLIGPQDKEWDKVLIVEYASKQDFVKMITMEGYPAEMRRSALEDSRLFFCQ